MKALLFVVASLLCCALAHEFALDEKNSNKVLVLLADPVGGRETFSMFFDFLEKSGYELTFSRGKEAPAVFNFGNLIDFEPDFEFVGDLRADTVVSFIDAGGNAIFASQIAHSDTLAEIFAECGFNLAGSDQETVALVDHFHFNSLTDSGIAHHVIVTLPPPTPTVAASPILGGLAKLPPVLYKGGCMTLAENDSPLHVPLLRAPETAYCTDPRRPLPTTPGSKVLAGSAITAVAALQARNNARVLVSASVEMFTDRYFTTKVLNDAGQETLPGNQVFCEAVARWTFQDKGKLRVVGSPKIVKIAGVTDPEGEEGFTIKDTMEYSIKFEEWDSAQKKWVPYTKNDVQLEVVMLDPYIRQDLKSLGDGTHTATFQLPDVYGLFTLRVTYRRLGYSWLVVEDRVAIRPYRHNQYERFIPSAYPYYAAALSMIAGVVVLAAVLLFHRDAKQKPQSQ